MRSAANKMKKRVDTFFIKRQSKTKQKKSDTTKFKNE